MNICGIKDVALNILYELICVTVGKLLDTFVMCGLLFPSCCYHT